MSHFALDFVPEYFSQDQDGGTGLLDIRRPGTTVVVNHRRVRGPLLKVPGVTGNHHPVTGNTQVYESQGSMRVGDELLFAIGPQLRIADTEQDVNGDQLWVQLKELGIIQVTDNADDTYRVAILGITYPFVASSNTIEEIRDGLLVAIGTPAGVSLVASGDDSIQVEGSVPGQNLQVVPTPASLTYVQTQFRNDKYELWKSARWSYGRFCQYTGKLMQAESGV